MSEVVPGSYLSIWRGEVLPPPPSKPKVRQVMTEVAAHYGLTLEDLTRHDTHRAISRIRAEAFYEARRRTGASYPLIGMVAGRDHTTILNQCRAHARRIGAA